MEIIIGNYTSPNNKLDKNFINKMELQDCILKDDNGVDVQAPEILVKGKKSNLSQYNYVYIKEFKSYYYLLSVDSYRNGLWRLNLKRDPLKTFRKEILALPAIIAKQETDHINNYYNDGTYVSEERNVVKVEQFPYRFDNNNIAYILTCI